jgi:mannose-6-phosphate isomerase-like protein (cupin superfamily)
MKEHTIWLILACSLAFTVASPGLAASPGPEPAPAPAPAPARFKVTPIAEKKVTELPAGPLFWRVENFGSLAQAKAAEGQWSLAAEAGGKAWLFTLGRKGGATPGATKRADIGPVELVTATNYLLRVNLAGGMPGAVTPVHSHPGSEAFFVLAGELSVRTPHGTMVVKAGRPERGHAPNEPMQASSSGSEELATLVMFVVDADKPFAPPASF